MPEVIREDDSRIGSAQWIKFLEDPSTQSFRYESHSGSFTARKRKDGAWNAYRKLFGKLRQEYLGLPQAISFERLEAIATKLDQSDLIYWSARAKKQKEVIQRKSITINSEATSYTETRITELEEELKRSQAKVTELEEIVEAAREVVKNMIPSKSNMIRGNALIRLRDKLTD